MVEEFKALENIPNEIQLIIKRGITTCIESIKRKVPSTGVQGEGRRPTDIIDIMRGHGEGKFDRSAINLFDGMGRALILLEEKEKKEHILVEDIDDIKEAREILRTILKDKTYKKKAGGTNPRNIRFRIVHSFELEDDGRPVVTERKDYFGHYKTKTVLKYLAARKKYAESKGEEYTGPNYTETPTAVQLWASINPNTSRPPLYIALELFEKAIKKILDEIKEVPMPPEPIVIVIDKGVKLEPFSKVAALKEGFREIVRNPEIYPKIPTRRDGKQVRGSNKPIIVSYDKSQRVSQKTFTSEVSDYVFRITSEDDRKLLDEAVPAWGEGKKDVAQTSSLEEFKIKVNSSRRTKTLVRLALGNELSTIRLPDRTPGVVLKAEEILDEMIKGKTNIRKLKIIDKIIDQYGPATEQEILYHWSTIKNSDGRLYRNIPTPRELMNLLAKNGYLKMGKGEAGSLIRDTYDVIFWGPRNSNITKGRNYSGRDRQARKLKIIDRILTNSSEPLMVRQILQHWRELRNNAGRPYKNIPTTNELGMLLRRHGYKQVGRVKNTSYWGPR